MTTIMRTRTRKAGRLKGWQAERAKGLSLSAFQPFSLLFALIVSFPLLAEPFQHPSLKAAVTVTRDARGIPYIKAANEHDLFFTQGYVTAGDRLFQLELLRRTVRGELAAVLGKELLEEDKRRRIYGFAHLADAAASQQAPDYTAAVAAYADGVNAWAEGHKDALPPEFAKLKIGWQPWKPADTLLIGYLFAEDLSTTWPTDLAVGAFANLPKETFDYFFPSTTPNDVYLVGDGKEPKNVLPGHIVVSTNDLERLDRLFGRPAESAEGFGQRSSPPGGRSSPLEGRSSMDEAREASNDWVVSGSKTATGKPMLANDPHLAATAPSIWYIVTLESPTIHAAGVTTPGVPGVILGHNDLIAWGCTNVGPDVQDLYRETFDGTKYKTPAGWEEAAIRKETIDVRGGEPVTIDVVTTRHGPVVYSGESGQFALQWPMLDPKQTGVFDAFYRLNRARNWGEFLAALRRYSGSAQNFVYADTTGNIGWYAAGRIPIRARGDGVMPVDGATDAEGAWTKFIPFDDLPHLFNPPSGLIVTANQRIAGPAYPQYLGTAWPTPYRARRILNLLSKKKKLTLDDLQAVQGDTYAWSDAVFAAEVAKMAKGKTVAEWQELARTLGTWDGMARPDSRALPLAMAMRDAFRRRILTAAFGEKAKFYRWPNSNAVLDRLITERPAAWLPKDMASYDALILATYADATQELTKVAGADPSKWTFGAIRHYRFQHPLARTDKAFDIDVPATSGGSSNPVDAGANVSMRFLADLSNWDNTRLGIALGESGDPSSPHWKDQLEAWLKVRPGVLVFSGR
jgi:penicillin amidase